MGSGGGGKGSGECEVYRIKAGLLMDVRSEDALGLEGCRGFEGLEMPAQKQINFDRKLRGASRKEFWDVCNWQKLMCF